MEAGTLVEWLVKPGDWVKRGDIVAVVETQKGAIEIEVFETGTLETLLAQPGQKMPVGTPMAFIRVDGGAVAGPAAPRALPSTAAAPAELPVAACMPQMAAPSARTGPRISPVARRRAAELGIAIGKLSGSGPGGAVTLADVERAARAGVPAPAQAMRNAIAAAMTRSKREIPHYYLATRIDMGRAVRWLDAENLRRSVTERLLPSVLILKATALALRKVPELNGFFRDSGFNPSDAVHLGVAISLRSGGLVAPALHDADRRSLDDLMATLRDLVQRARAGVLRSSELSDATVTVTNLGDQGVETVFGVISPPQVALVGFGRLREEPWAENGMLGVRPAVTATLAADHRASDGHRGGVFLSALDRLMQSPEKL
ncbi:MAG TPA: 2-oxo acid dehydrogenase subunit E2 [Deltaproteobacteria bacterium]|nr:2-oxo acid dehydrogenase subunit E2 [Deltaproteobacteria bacterium]